MAPTASCCCCRTRPTRGRASSAAAYVTTWKGRRPTCRRCGDCIRRWGPPATRRSTVPRKACCAWPRSAWRTSWASLALLTLLLRLLHILLERLHVVGDEQEGVVQGEELQVVRVVVVLVVLAQLVELGEQLFDG